MITGKGKQLNIFIGETDRYQHQSLYMAIIERLRREGCSGATAVRGIAGFGPSSTIHTSAILRLSMDMPIVITVIDRPERIERILEPLREMAPNALITIHEIDVAQPGAPLKEGLPDLKVSEVMNRTVVTVAPDSSLTKVVELLLDKDFTAVPVVDDAGRVVGMISDSDLLTRGNMGVTLSLKRAADPDFVRELHRALTSPDRKVGEVMTRAVETITPDGSLASAARLMVAKKLKRLPVIGKDGRLVGIVGRLDVLNTIAAVHLPEWRPTTLPASARNAKVKDVMNPEAPMLSESATLSAIYELMAAAAIKRIVVVDKDRRVVGIIADSDLISRMNRESWPALIEVLASKVPIQKIRAPALANLQRLRARSARELMTREVVTVREEMPVASALALSAEKGVKRMPVINAESILTGIVGRTELLRALLADGAGSSEA